MKLALILALSLLAAVLVFFVLPTLVLAGVLYTVLLVRTKPEKWGRECSLPDDAEYKQMFDEGIAWDAQHKACKKQVEIKSGKFRLVGEYFDFGAKKAVIIIPGRMESLLYSYFFAEPYRAAGYNVLVIDNRAHGLSEGKINSLGYREYRDLLAWGALLHDTLGNDTVVLHGICIGASTALFALTADGCPDYFGGMIGEGMYVNFYESFRNHLILGKHKTFPLLGEVMAYIRIVSGANVVTDGPLNRIERLNKPILFLHSREDVFSTPDKAQLLFDACRSEKQLVWFDKGDHSRIRINDHAGYDAAIVQFLHGTVDKTADSCRGM